MPLLPACICTRTCKRKCARLLACPLGRCMHIYTHAHTRQVVLAESLFALAWRSGMADKAHLRKVARMVGRLSKTHGKEYADLQMRLDVLC